MKELLFLALSMMLGIQSFSQIAFEKGYFIDDSNHKTECLIKNNDWKNNPNEFEYKLAHDTIAQKIAVGSVKEFGIDGVSKYVTTIVKIDRSRNELNNLSSEKKPKFQEEQLALKVLIEGMASLYLYEDVNLRRYFYQLKDSEIKQLVYKRYLIDKNIAQNNDFRQQLLMDLKCQAIELKDVKLLNYTQRDLERIFIKYNECESSSFINYESEQKKDLFNLSFRPGLNYSNLRLQGFREIDFDHQFNFRFGIEAEFILPFNKNKWGMTIEPTYQQFESGKTTEVNYVSGGILVSKVNYQSIELPIGVRHYFFLNDQSKIFIDLSYILDYQVNSFIKNTRFDGTEVESLEINSRRNLGLGIGYKYRDKYSLSMRYQTRREILSNYLSFDSGYETFSVIFGYSIF